MFYLSTLHKMSNLKVGLSYSRKSPSSFSVEMTISVLSDSKKAGHGSWSKGLPLHLESVVCCPSHTHSRLQTDTRTRHRRFLMCMDTDDSNFVRNETHLNQPVELWGRNYSAAQCLVLASVVKSKSFEQSY